jgi:hypothetical protein
MQLTTAEKAMKTDMKMFGILKWLQGWISP